MSVKVFKPTAELLGLNGLFLRVRKLNFSLFSLLKVRKQPSIFIIKNVWMIFTTSIYFFAVFSLTSRILQFKLLQFEFRANFLNVIFKYFMGLTLQRLCVDLSDKA